MICGNPDCPKPGTDMCSRCKSVFYCSRDCQRSHWKAGHKKVCKKAGVPAGRSSSSGAGKGLLCAGLLIEAASVGDTLAVRRLLSSPGSDVDVRDEFGQTPLLLAAGKGHVECVELLLAAPGVLVNQAHKDGATPLYIAAVYGRDKKLSLIHI